MNNDTYKKLFGEAGYKDVQRLAWTTANQILRTIQNRSPHWYQRIFDPMFKVWINIPKKRGCFNLEHRVWSYMPDLPYPRKRKTISTQYSVNPQNMNRRNIRLHG